MKLYVNWIKRKHLIDMKENTKTFLLSMEKNFCMNIRNINL